MSTSQTTTITLRAEGDLSTKRYYAAKLDTTTARSCAVAADGIEFIGFIEHAGKELTAGDLHTPAIESRTYPVNCAVAVAGRAIAIAAGAITVGAPLTVNANGKVVATTTPGDIVVARALEAASTDGDHISVLIVSKHEVPTP